MRSSNKLILLAVLNIFIFLACSSHSKSENNDAALTDRVLLSEPSTSNEQSSAFQEDQISRGRVSVSKKTPNFLTTIATLGMNDGDRLLIRTADTKFKVKDVVDATYFIENIINKNGGIIVNSTISNDNWNAQELPVSRDSALVVTHNILSAKLILRVPKDMLDVTLREIAPLAVNIDYRTLKADDVTFDILLNQLTQARLGRKSKRVANAISTRSAKLEDAVNAEEALDNVEEMADNATIEKFKLKDKIDFCTINIQLYQDRFETISMIKRVESIDVYKPGLISKALVSLSNGWSGLCYMLILLLNLWPLFLIVLVGAFIYLKFRKKTSK